jgi:hypothetical protein
MKQINLYQSEFRPPKILLPARSLAISGVVFIAGLLALSAWERWQLSQLQVEVEQITQRAVTVTRQLQAHAPGARQADPKLLLDAQALEQQARALKQAQDAINSGEVGAETGYSAQFRALARATSPGAWLTGVIVSDSGRALDLHGRALTGAAPARLIARLRGEPLLVGLSFAGLEVHQPKEDASDAGATPPAHAASPLRTPPRTPPSFLEFSLNARLTESATGPTAGQKQGSAP